MRSLLFSVVFLCMTCLVRAQGTGWDWVQVSTPVNNIEGYLTATDKNNNVYVGMWESGNGSLSVSFGGVGVSNPLLYTESIVVKYDSGGTAQWALPLQGDGALIGLTVDPQNNVLVFGTFYDSIQIGSTLLRSTIGEYYIAQVSPGGIVNWVIKDGGHCTGGFQPLGYYALSGGIKTDADGNIYVASNYSGKSINIGSFTLANSDTSGVAGDMFVAKYSYAESASWHAVWAKSAGGIKDDWVRAFAVSPQGNSYITGMFQSPSITFGSTTITNSTPSTSFAMHVMKFDTNGNPVWAGSSQGHMGAPSGIATDDAENIYITGSFKDTLPIAGTTIYDPTDGANIFLVKMDASQNLLWYKTATLPIGSWTGVRGVTPLAVTTDDCENVWMDGSMGYGSAKVYYFLLDGHRIDSAPLANHFLPRYSEDAGFVAGFTASGNYIAGRGLQSGFDDMNTLACSAGGNLYMASDFTGGYVIARSDTLVDTTFKERFLLAKYKYDTVGCGKTGIQLVPMAGHMQLYPNPATTEYTLHADVPLQPGSYAVLYDVFGRVVGSYLLSGSDNVLPLDGVAGGVYECIVEQPGFGRMDALKLVVTK